MVTLSPSDEACQVIVEVLNNDSSYILEANATYTRLQIDPMEQLTSLRVDVVPDTEKTPNETLDFSDYSSHELRVWIRSPLPPDDTSYAITELMTLKRQIFRTLECFSSPDNVVTVWECDDADEENPSKSTFFQTGMFVAFIKLRVEVQP